MIRAPKSADQAVRKHHLADLMNPRKSEVHP